VKRTRQRDGDFPGPQAPWDEIVPGLWMGGHSWTDPSGELQPVVVGGEFDLVVSLFTRPGHGPRHGVAHLVAEMPDGPLTPSQIGAVQDLAKAAAQAVSRGRTTLVRCHSGYNRSGLVVAQALVNLVQSAFGESAQGEISGLSRSVSNLGSSLGTAIAGTILASNLTHGGYAAAMIVLGAFGLIGLAAASRLPAGERPVDAREPRAAAP
jgi:hypothetical protein